jgi:hypothetical protein
VVAVAVSFAGTGGLEAGISEKCLSEGAVTSRIFVLCQGRMIFYGRNIL